MASPDAGPSPPTDRLGRWYLLAVFVAVAIVVAASYVVYSSQPPRTPRTDNLVFSRPAISDGNASFVVENTSGGPYPYYGFRVNLVVNGFAGESAPLGPGGMSIRFPIGPNVYVVVWDDADGNGAVSTGDPWAVTGDGAPLPTLSLYEFDLEWQTLWTAKAFWSTT